MLPDFIHIGPLDIHTYGVCVAIGFAAGIWLATRRARQQGLDTETISNLAVWLILAGMAGGKLFHIVFFWDDVARAWRLEGMRSLREGFVFYGGFIGACVTTIFYCRAKTLPLWKVADVFAPSVALGHAFGRLGCFFNGCCYGKICAQPWAVKFPPPHVMAGIPVQPTQLYEVAGNLAICAGLIAFTRHRKPSVRDAEGSGRQFDGQTWWLYVLFYGALRFAIEFFRGDYTTHYLGVLTLGHVIALGMMFVAMIAQAVMRPAKQSL